jgi:hypothetical protein
MMMMILHTIQISLAAGRNKYNIQTPVLPLHHWGYPVQKIHVQQYAAHRTTLPYSTTTRGWLAALYIKSNGKGWHRYIQTDSRQALLSTSLL